MRIKLGNFFEFEIEIDTTAVFLYAILLTLVIAMCWVGLQSGGC